MSNRTLKVLDKSTVYPRFPRHALDQTRRRSICDRLNRVLVATIDGAQSAEHAYWNARGPSALFMRPLFDRTFMELRMHSNLIAERIINLGGLSKSFSPMVVRESCLKPYPIHDLSCEEHAEEMVKRLGHLTGEMRLAIDECSRLGDPISTNVIQSALHCTEKLRRWTENHVAKVH